MTRLEVLSRLPLDVREAIRSLEADIEEHDVFRYDVPDWRYMEMLGELDKTSVECIKAFLRCSFKEEVDEAYRALSNR